MKYKKKKKIMNNSNTTRGRGIDASTDGRFKCQKNLKNVRVWCRGGETKEIKLCLKMFFLMTQEQQHFIMDHGIAYQTFFNA